MIFSFALQDKKSVGTFSLFALESPTCNKAKIRNTEVEIKRYFWILTLNQLNHNVKNWPQSIPLEWIGSALLSDGFAPFQGYIGTHLLNAENTCVFQGNDVS